jgi:hypothetical protein
MNSDSNTEIDLLLRRYGRRKATFASGDEAAKSTETTASTGPHMDADEMNAYAERQMPDPARSRALQHLADCDQCRAVVARLTLAANVPIEAVEQDTQQQPSRPRTSWLTWLAALFAPPVMRYATAAVVLLCVVGAAFLVVRRQKDVGQQEEPTLVAQNNKSERQDSSALKSDAPGQQQSATEASPSAPQASTVAPGAEPAPLKDNKAGGLVAPTDGEAEERSRQMNEVQPAETARTDAPVGGLTPLPPKQTAPELSARDQQRDQDFAVDTTPAARPPATLSPSVAATRAEQPATEADKTRQNRKEGTTSDDRSARGGATSNTTATARESEGVSEITSQEPPATARSRRAARKPEAKTKGADAAGRAGSIVAETSTETRNIGGRQFRRRGGAWVDTAYSSGQASVNVRRGSEQYRALVADEPGLRSIAEQLGGEVIVVWKGRAYRIR